MNDHGYFPENPEVALLPDGRIRLLRDFRYFDPSDREWLAPAGTVSDGASIPRFAWSLVGGPLDGPYRDAAIIHDVGCDERSDPWWVVHQVFYHGMRARQVNTVKAKIMYGAVFHFGPRWETVVRMRGITESVEVRVPAASPTMTPEEFDALATEIEAREERGDPMSLEEISLFAQDPPTAVGEEQGL